MTSLAGPIHAAALVVLVAAAAKARRPAAAGVAMRTLGLPGSRGAVRVVAVVEATVAVGVLAGAGDGQLVPLLAALHLAFAAIALLLWRRSATCGCFGEATPVTETHVWVNVVVACTCLAAATADGVPSIGAVIGATPAAGVPYALLVVVLAAAEITMLTALAEVQSVLKAIAHDVREVSPSERVGGR